MKKRTKNQLLELAGLLEQAHVSIKKNLEKKDENAASAMLMECQNTAIAIGNKIEETEGEGTSAVQALEEYCELVYKIYEKILRGDDLNPRKVFKLLGKSYLGVSEKIRNDISEIREVVFLPYKASMWDSLESVWKRAAADPKTEAVVIPIPYYDKNPDGTFLKMHYEGAMFPEDVPVVHYESYNFNENHPDEIYIHNPYDETNRVTSVHPFFYSKNLKQYTDKLVYIPYFVIEEVDLSNPQAVENRSHLVQLPAVVYADEVIVQSENMRQMYIENIVKVTGKNSRKVFEAKIKGTGSPKIEKIKSMCRDDILIPEEWKKYLYRSEGERKKVILYNTSLSTYLREQTRIFTKIMSVFHYFNANKENVTLLWRPHPLLEATVKSMTPHLLREYQALVEYYKTNDIGIYDDTADMDRAIILADAYYGDGSSLVTLCKAINMPVMIQNMEIINHARKE